MRALLICFGILTLLVPVVVIIGNILGKTLISDNEYFFIVLVFIAGVVLYDKKKHSCCGGLVDILFWGFGSI